MGPLLTIKPAPGGAVSEDHSHTVPAPTGNGRYFAYGFSGVYDAEADRWLLTGFGGHDGYFAWGESHDEVRYVIGFVEGGGEYGWNRGAPAITEPPFDELSYRVTGTGSCLNLRAQPDRDGAVLRCLPDGTRVTAAMPPPLEANGCGRWSARASYVARSCYPATTGRMEAGYGNAPSTNWVYVGTEDGREGWVAHHAGVPCGQMRYLERIPPERDPRR